MGSMLHAVGPGKLRRFLVRIGQLVIGSWIDYYNTSRPHSVFDGRTPEEVYSGRDAPSPGHALEMAPEALAA